MNEATLRETEHGLVPETDGWFVLNTKDAVWLENEDFGRYTRWEGDGDARFPELGINISVLRPGQPMCMYHGEDAQENFLVLAGEAVLIVEGQERSLRAWDFVHCPAWTKHVVVAAGGEPCVVLAVGSRGRRGVVYTVDDVARKHRAGVEQETSEGAEAYAAAAPDVSSRYRDGDLPG